MGLKAYGWTALSEAAGRPPVWSHHSWDPITANSRFLLETNSQETIAPTFTLCSLIDLSLFAQSICYLSFCTWNFPLLKLIFVLTLKCAWFVWPFSQAQGCVICMSCLWMTLHGKNESLVESFLFFFSHLQFFGTYLSLPPSASHQWQLQCFISLLKSKTQSFLKNMCMWPVKVWRLLKLWRSA